MALTRLPQNVEMAPGAANAVWQHTFKSSRAYKMQDLCSTF